MPYELLITIAAGFAGGLIRAAVGILKWQTRAPTQRRMNFSSHYLVATVLLAGILGIVAGLYVANDPRFAVLAGYAGTDFIEGLYRAKFKKRKARLSE
jgi:NADH:ubiquinone oxidoreductase subunit 6 (subunit J)